MAKHAQLALKDPAEWLGNWHPLAEQLGSADGLVELGSVSRHLSISPVHDVPTFQVFLRHYHQEILFPIELVAVNAAYGHASSNELRELVALDQQIASRPVFDIFAGASRRVGQAQLQKLRPLRDQRIVQRYLNAVESSQANGWHTLVYGLTLAVYSLPLRQGLLGYAHQTTRSFIYSAAKLLKLSEQTCRQIFDESTAPLPETVENLLRDKVIG